MAPVRAVWCYTTSNTTSNTSIEGEEERDNDVGNEGERIQLRADEEYPCVYRDNDSDSQYRPVNGHNLNVGEDMTGTGSGIGGGSGSDCIPGLIRPIELNDFCKYGVQH